MLFLTKVHSVQTNSFPITSWPFDIFRLIVVLNLLVIEDVYNSLLKQKAEENYLLADGHSVYPLTR